MSRPVVLFLLVLGLLCPTPGCSHTDVDHPTGTTSVQGGPGFQNVVNVSATK